MKKWMSNVLENRKAQKMGQVAALSTSTLVLSAGAMAGTSGAEFKETAEMVVGWAEGYLGIMLAIVAFIIGGLVGLMKSTMMPMIVGIGFAMAFTLAPTIIQSMFTAVIM